MGNSVHSLVDMKPGQSAMVRALCCEGVLRGRLMDMGLVENSKVMCIADSPLGDPKLFLICGAAVALRNPDSSRVLVSAL